MSGHGHVERIGTYAMRCALCDREPRWRLMRIGDVRITWACTDHLTLVLIDLLPTGKHRDQAVVTDLANTWTAL